MEDYLRFSNGFSISIDDATREHISLYVHDLTTRPRRHSLKVCKLGSGAGLANATLQQKLTALRLYYDYLIEEGHRLDNPVGRGRFTQGKAFGGKWDRGLIPRFHKLPWIPTDKVSHAGIILIKEMVDQLGIAALIDQELKVKEREPGYPESESVLALCWNLILGGEHLSDLEILRGDPGTQQMLGLESVIAQLRQVSSCVSPA
jgi:hypothetical protein